MFPAKKVLIIVCTVDVSRFLIKTKLHMIELRYAVVFRLSLIRETDRGELKNLIWNERIIKGPCIVIIFRFVVSSFCSSVDITAAESFFKWMLIYLGPLFIAS